MSILPNIIDVAKENGLKVTSVGKRGSGGIGNEFKTSCPFCGDKKQHLQLNSEKGVFKCYRCAESGGVLKLMQQLTGKSKEELIKGLRKNKGLTQNKKYFHPAMKIPTETLKSMGFIGNNNYYNKMKKDPIGTKQELDWIWREYKKYKRDLKRLETKILNSIIKNKNIELEKQLRL